MSVALQMVLAVQGMSMSSLPEGSVAFSRADCVTRCHFNQTCSSILYDTFTNACHLVDIVYMEAELNVSTSSMQYLVWETGSCGSSYNWYRALNLCLYLSNEKSSWQKAQEQCSGDGSHLIKVENSDINELMNRLVDRIGTPLWLGANDIAVEGKWVWSDSSLVSAYFWDAGEPDVGDQNCVRVVSGHGKSANRWRDAYCNSKRHFVCQKPMEQLSVQCIN